MTGNELLTRAMQLLGYTTHMGEADNSLNAELIRRGLPILQQVLADLYRIKHPEKPEPLPTDLNAEILLSEDEAVRVAVPGMAMYLAKGAGDNESYNLYSDEYHRHRNSVKRATTARVDVQPTVSW
ncbi:MAG: hypothetical protein IJO42_00760 [Clostridia bacterium]|nr:hypothetical protein [Clostridia bacterium]